MKISTVVILVVLAIGAYFINRTINPDCTTTPQVEWDVGEVQNCNALTKEDGTLKLDCVDYNGPAEDIDAVTAKQLPPPSVPTITIAVHPITITMGGTTTVSWVSTNTTECWHNFYNEDTWVMMEKKKLSGSWPELTPTVDTTYTVVCSGPDGTIVKDSITVVVND